MARLAAARPTISDLDRERPVVLRELAHEAEERRRIWQLLSEALYGVEHPLAYPILGTGESLAAIGIDDLDQVRDRWRAGNAALAIVGPVDAQTVLEHAEAILRASPGDVEDARDPRPEPVGRRHEERRSGLLHIACGWRFGGVDDEQPPRAPPRRDRARARLGLAPVRPAAHPPAARLSRLHRAHPLSRLGVPRRGHRVRPPPRDSRPRPRSSARSSGSPRAGPTFPELEAARRQLHGSLARAYEVSRRLAGLAATQLLFDRLEPVDDLFARIAACEPADVAAAAAALVGPGQTHADRVGRPPAPLTPSDALASAAPVG